MCGHGRRLNAVTFAGPSGLFIQSPKVRTNLGFSATKESGMKKLLVTMALGAATVAYAQTTPSPQQPSAPPPAGQTQPAPQTPAQPMQPAPAATCGPATGPVQ